MNFKVGDRVVTTGFDQHSHSSIVFPPGLRGVVDHIWGTRAHWPIRVRFTGKLPEKLLARLNQQTESDVALEDIRLDRVLDFLHAVLD